MSIEDFLYIVNTNKNFDEAVVSVLKSIEHNGWSIFQIYDIRERLAAKGFNHERMKIVEMCSARYANNLLNKNKLVSLCMPCKINIIEDNGKIKIVGIRPKLISYFFKEINEDDVKNIENELKVIIDEAK